VHTIRQVVDVVSKYVGGALPEPAKGQVRGFILKLPQRWVSKASSGPGVGSGGLGERERERVAAAGTGTGRCAGRVGKGGQCSGRGAQGQVRMDQGLC